MPERSGSTPIVWGDHMFLNVGEGPSLALWAVDRASGAVRWKRPLGGGNRRMMKQQMSSPSPVTDGASVWVMTGTGVLKAFDFAGKELWGRDIQADYGRFGLQWGYASSPLLFEDALYVQVLHGMHTDDPSYLLRIDKATGKTVWRVLRMTACAIRIARRLYDAGAPAAGERDRDRHHRRRRRHGPRSGDWPGAVARRWPQSAQRRQLPDRRLAGGARRSAVCALAGAAAARAEAGRPRRRHELARALVVQQRPRCADAGDRRHVSLFDQRPRDLYCLDAKTGKVVYGPQRLRNATYSGSAVLADGKIYITDEDGVTTVFRAGPKFELLSENDLQDYTLSSPAVSDGQIFVRTASFIYAIGRAGGGTKHAVGIGDSTYQRSLGASRAANDAHDSQGRRRRSRVRPRPGRSAVPVLRAAVRHGWRLARRIRGSFKRAVFRRSESSVIVRHSERPLVRRRQSWPSRSEPPRLRRDACRDKPRRGRRARQRRTRRRQDRSGAVLDRLPGPEARRELSRRCRFWPIGRPRG